MPKGASTRDVAKPRDGENRDAMSGCSAEGLCGGREGSGPGELDCVSQLVVAPEGTTIEDRSGGYGTKLIATDRADNVHGVYSGVAVRPEMWVNPML